MTHAATFGVAVPRSIDCKAKPIMSTILSPRSAVSTAEELQTLQKHWVWFLALGIVMTALGMFAIGSACIATVTVTVTWLFGFLLLGGGIAEIVSSFSAGRWGGTLLHLLIGVLYVMVGLMIIEQPENSAIQLTLIIAIFLMISGVFRIVAALSERFVGWGWVLLNGGVTLLLGMLIWKQWPLSGLWVIGLFVGIDLIFNGWAWIMLSLGLRNAPPIKV
jgi:uncharacterized membrane protein HdeD (DUF308 family)